MTNSNHEKRIESILTFNDVMDEALVEHQAQKAAEKEKLETEQRARWQEQQKIDAENRRKVNVKNSEHLRKIAEVIMPDRRDGKHRNRTWSIDEEKFSLTIDGIDVSYQIQFEQQWKRQSSWRSSPTGKMKFVIGDYGSRQTFPERKDGTFNYIAIAERLCSYADRQNAAKRMERQRIRNANAVLDVTRKIFPDPEKSKYQDVIAASADPDKPIFFKFKIEKAMTADQAEKLAAAIRSAGIKLHYSDEMKS